MQMRAVRARAMEARIRCAPALRAKLAEHVAIWTAFVDLETEVIPASVLTLDSREVPL